MNFNYFAMGLMKFKYFKFPLKKYSSLFGSVILKPIIPVRIACCEQSIDYAVLIDSGADFCLFDGEIGEYLGLDVRAGKQETFGGIEESRGAVAYLHEINLEIGSYEFSIMAGFSYDIARHGFGILGQKGFFDKFAVKFNLPKEEIELKPYGKASPTTRASF